MRTKQLLRIFLGLVWAAMAINSAGQANMRREGSLTLNETLDDSKGFYAATIDPANGFAYFAAKYVYKVNITTPLPLQVGAGVPLGRQAYSAVMDSSAGCAYFAVGTSLYQVLANGTNAPTAGVNMISPFGSSTFLSQLLLDTSDPANHYLYVMTETAGTSSTLYKLALNQYPNLSAIIGSAGTTAGQPGLGYGALDLTNRCAYYGTFIPIAGMPPYLAKFALGAGANPPTNLGGIFLDTETNRSVGAVVLDVANGYGYCDSDGNDGLYGRGRVYKWALNGTAPPTLAAYVDMRTNEGYCHVAAIRPQNGLLYFASDLSYPMYVYRFRLPPGTNAPIETGNLGLLPSTNAVVPAWGTNPTNSADWGEVFARSIAYDPIRDFVYIGRDCADGQTQPFTNQIVKLALDRDEMLLALTDGGTATNSPLPFRESFESYTNGASLVGMNGWTGQDSQMALVNASNYTGSYSGAYPIPGTHQNLLRVDGAVTNHFSPSASTNVWLDTIVQGRYWTDPITLTLSNSPFAACVTTNGHLAVWNRTNAPATGNGWTELKDTSIASNQFFRLTLQAVYNRNGSGAFSYRVWVNATPSTNPQTWYDAASTNQNYLGGVLGLGRFELDDLTVGTPGVVASGVSRNPNGSATVLGSGMPGMAHRLWAATNLASPSWQVLSTTSAGMDGTLQFTETNAPAGPARFYRVTLP